MSIGSILNMARSGMNVQQTAVQTASQNISNAQTEGYSRQRVEMATSLSTIFPYGTLGTGVQIKSITRARDAMLDATYRANVSNKAGSETTSAALSQIQSIFDEPSDNGLSATLDAFWSAWGDLANDPTSGAAKGAVRAAGDNVASTLNRFARQIDDVDSTNRASIAADVGQANAYAKQVVELNKQIIAAESNGNEAGDLRDERDRIFDKLATLTGGTVVNRDNGSAAFLIGGRMLVDGSMVKSLEMSSTVPPTVSFAGETPPLQQLSGTLGARLDISANRIPAVFTKLDALAKGLVSTINSIHSTGRTYTGTPAVAGAAGDFFQAGNVTARSIRLSSTLVSGADVAASAGTATGPGNADVAAALAALRGGTVAFTDGSGNPLGSDSISGFYTNAIGELATTAHYAEDDASVQATLASNAETRRMSVSGVSTDEELISVIQHQHSYQAAARLVSVVDEMTQTLIDLGR
jgi:flagellar hook-associated protein 1 FlgK